MFYEKLFYKELLEQGAQIERQIAVDNSVMTPNALTHSSIKQQQEIEAIIKRAEAQQSRAKSLPLPLRKTRFSRLSQRALRIAEALGMDIAIKTTSDRGFIRLTTGLLLMDDTCHPPIRRKLKVLIARADYIWIEPLKIYDEFSIRLELDSS